MSWAGPPDTDHAPDVGEEPEAEPTNEPGIALPLWPMTETTDPWGLCGETTKEKP
ncbi:MAG: hypothetical protein ABI193_01885 [Minicystis sp.]